MKKSKERIITSTRNNTNASRIKGKTMTIKEKWEEKRLYWYLSNKEVIIHETTWKLQSKEKISIEIESLLMAAQNTV